MSLRVFWKAIVPLLIRKCGTHAFSAPNLSNNAPKRSLELETFPRKTEDWDQGHVGSWLHLLGFGRYAPAFAADFGGVGVDGCRLDYLGTEDNLDHIEYQLSLVGVEDECDQRVLGDAIIQLVAASEVSSDLLESLARKIPVENKDTVDAETDGIHDYQI